MSSPERRRFSASDQSLSTLGALALVPSAAIIEYYDLPGYRLPQPLITKGSLRTYQDNSERYSQSIAKSAWYNLSTCVPGTRAARRNQDLIVHATPNFSNFAQMHPDDPAEVLGFATKKFSYIIEIAAVGQDRIPGMGPTAANFLLDLAGVVEIELRASE